jgi:hypothetical protein
MDHGAIRILYYDAADEKSAHKFSEFLSFQVAVIGFSPTKSPTANFLLVQSFVLALQASNLRRFSFRSCYGCILLPLLVISDLLDIPMISSCLTETQLAAKE